MKAALFCSLSLAAAAWLYALTIPSALGACGAIIIWTGGLIATAGQLREARRCAKLACDELQWESRREVRPKACIQ